MDIMSLILLAGLLAFQRRERLPLWPQIDCKNRLPTMHIQSKGSSSFGTEWYNGERTRISHLDQGAPTTETPVSRAHVSVRRKIRPIMYTVRTHTNRRQLFSPFRTAVPFWGQTT